MAALLVGMSIVAVMMTVAMPVWRQMARREMEEELVFRGQQWARAVGLFQRKYANTAPPSLDVLVTERMVRKRYRDPMTGKDFLPILAGTALAAGGAAPAAGQTGQVGRGDAVQRQATPAQAGRGTTPVGTPGAGATGGVVGVTSASKDKSIRLYNGRTHYNEWAFVYMPQVQQAGQGGVPGTATPGVQRGQPGDQGRGGRGNPTGPGNPPGRGNPNPNGPARGNNPFGTQDPFGPNRGGTNPFQPQTPTPRGR